MNKRPRYGWYALMWLCAAAQGLAQTQVQAQAQGVVPAKTTDAKQVTALIPADAVGLLTVRPRLIAQDEAFKLLPLELVTAAGLDNLGLDPWSIERVDAIIDAPGPEGAQVAILVTSSVPITPEQIKAGFIVLDNPAVEAGRKFYSVVDLPDAAAVFVADRQMLLGNRAYISRLLNAKPTDGPLRQQAARLGDTGHATLVVVFPPMRKFLIEQLARQNVAPPIRADVSTLAEKSTMLAVRLQLGAEPLMPIVLEAGSETDIAEIEASWKRLLKFVGLGIHEQMQRQIGDKDSLTSKALIAYSQRYLAELERLLTPTRSGNRLVLRVDGSLLNSLQSGTVFGALIPMTKALQDARPRARAPALGLPGDKGMPDNMLKIGLAMHHFESLHKALPIAGQNQLSWRVQILPYVDEAALFNEYKHDEPWDSPHNIKLLERMPAIFQHPQAKVAPGHTVYQMPTGPGLAAEIGKATRFRDITDGTSNTIMIVVTTDDAAVPWTKPEDINPLENLKLLGKQDGNHTAIMFDGSVKRMPVQIPLETLKALLTRNGGEVGAR